MHRYCSLGGPLSFFNKNTFYLTTGLVFFLSLGIASCNKVIKIFPNAKTDNRATLEGSGTNSSTSTLLKKATKTSSTSSTSTSTATAVDTVKPIDFTKYYKLVSSSTESLNKCLEANQHDSLVKSGGAFMDDCHNTTGQYWKLTAISEGVYKLTAQFYEPLNKCLEANSPASAIHSQASFMDVCQNVNSQSWKLIPEANKVGYYRIVAESLEAQNRCLDANVPNDTVHKGAVFMEDCQGNASQLWKLASPSSGLSSGGLDLASVEPLDQTKFYRIKSKLLETASKCLEGNQTGSGLHGDAIFMDTCQEDSPGQFWKFTPIPGGYYKLTTQIFDPQNIQCLESSQPPNSALMYSPCASVTGQSWKLIPQGDGYYQLTSQFRESAGECLVSNQTDGTLNDGASHMEACQAIPAQLWKIILQQ